MSPISKFGKKKLEPPPYLMLSETHFELHGQMTLEQVLNICFTAQLRYMQSTLNGVPPEHRDEAKGYFYDMFNKSAAKLLEIFAPELETHPDLTAEAILRAENAILDEFRESHPQNEETKVALAHAQAEIDECARRQLSFEECASIQAEKAGIEAQNVREEEAVPQNEPVCDGLPVEPFG